jgi:hypothetical protein
MPFAALLPANPVVWTPLDVCDSENSNFLGQQFIPDVIRKSLQETAAKIPLGAGRFEPSVHARRCENSRECVAILVEKLFAQSFPSCRSSYQAAPSTSSSSAASVTRSFMLAVFPAAAVELVPMKFPNHRLSSRRARRPRHGPRFPRPTPPQPPRATHERPS